MSRPLFVYGTLMRGAGREHLVGVRRRGAATTTGTLYDLPAGYPALVLQGRDTVHGEWIDPVPDAVLRLLDRYEGVEEGLYRRVVVPVRAGSSTVQAWAWVMDDATGHGGVRLPHGRWRALRRR